MLLCTPNIDFVGYDAMSTSAATTKILTALSTMLSVRSQYPLNAVLALSSMKFEDLLVDNTLGGLRNFIRHLQEIIQQIEQDYEHFVSVLFDSQNKSCFYSSVSAISTRCAFKCCYLCLRRFEKALFVVWKDQHEKLKSFGPASRLCPSPEILQIYYETLIIPRKEVYQGLGTGIRVVVDILHFIFCASVSDHLCRLTKRFNEKDKDMVFPQKPSFFSETASFRSKQRSKTWQQKQSKIHDCDICPENPCVDRLLNYVVFIASYPVIPPDLAGSIVVSKKKAASSFGSGASTLGDNCSSSNNSDYPDDNDPEGAFRGDEDLDGKTRLEKFCANTGLQVLNIEDPGVDSRRYVQQVSDVRPCVRCALNNVSVGIVDVMEQVIRCKCRCVLAFPSSGNFNKAVEFSLLTRDNSGGGGGGAVGSASGGSSTNNVVIGGDQFRNQWNATHFTRASMLSRKMCFLAHGQKKFRHPENGNICAENRNLMHKHFLDFTQVLENVKFASVL